MASAWLLIKPTGDVSAPAGVCKFQITFKPPPAQAADVIAFWVGDILIGSLGEKRPLLAGQYDVQLDLRELGDGPQAVIARAYRSSDTTTPLLEADPFTAVVTGVGDAKKRPESVRLRRVAGGPLGAGGAVVLWVIEDEVGVPLTDGQWSVQAAVGGQVVAGIEIHGAEIRLPIAALPNEGRKRIELTVSSGLWPQRATKLDLPLLVDRTPPLVETSTETVFSRDATPEITIRVRDAASGVDFASLVLTVDREPTAAMVKWVDRRPPPPRDIGAPAPAPPIGPSTVKTVADLSTELTHARAGMEAVRRLSAILANMRAALDRGRTPLARERLGHFIVETARLSNADSRAAFGLALEDANHLLRGAANVLSSISLARSAPVPASPSSTTTFWALAASLDGIDVGSPAKKALRDTLDAARRAAEAREGAIARLRLARLCDGMIEATNRAPASVNAGSLAQGNDLVRDAIDVLCGIVPSGYVTSAALPSATEVAAVRTLVRALSTSRATITMLERDLDRVEDALGSRSGPGARKRLGDLVHDAVERSGLPEANHNRIAGPGADAIIEATLNLLLETPLGDGTTSFVGSSMVGTIDELAFEVADLGASPATVKALENLISHASNAETHGVVSVVRDRIEQFLREVLARSDDRRGAGGVSPDDANSLISGAANLLLGRVPWMTLAVRPNRALPDGMHRFGVAIADAAGNRRLVERTVCVDTAPPAIIAIAPPEGAIAGPDLHVVARVAPDLSGVAAFELRLDGAVVEGASFDGYQITWTSPARLADGPHTIAITADDRAGNRGSRVWRVDVDAVPPEIDQLRPIPGLPTNLDRVLVFARLSDTRSGVDPASVRVLVDGYDLTASANVQADSVSLVLDQPVEGTHAVRIECADRGGNAATPAEYTFVADRTPPHIAFEPELDHMPVTAAQVRVVGTLSEPATIDVNRVRAEVSADLRFAASIALVPGHNRIEANATDLAGNQAAATPIDVYRVGDEDSAVTGFVLDPAGKPVIGVVVTDPRSGLSGVTGSSGRFALYGVPAGKARLYVDPSHSLGGTYRPFSIRLDIAYGRVSSPLTPIYLVESAIDQGTDIPVGGGATVIGSAGSVTLTVPNDELVFPEGEPRRIAVCLVASDRLPVDVPGYVTPGAVAVLEPSGLEITAKGGAAITLPNHTGMASGAIVPLIAYSGARARWELGGFGRISEDEQRVESIEGLGLHHFSFVTATPLGPELELLREDMRAPGADSLKGALELDLTLPAFRCNGQAIEPTLSYSSMSAAPSLLITGVFRGLKEITSTPTHEVIPPVDVNQRGMRQVATDKCTVWRKRKWWEFWEDEDILVDDKPAAIAGEAYVPGGTQPPFAPIDTSPKDEDSGVTVHFVRTVAEEKDLWFYKAHIDTTVDRQSGAWPESITSRYLFSDIDTGEFTLMGAPRKRGPEPRPGEMDTRQEFPTLPEDLALTYHIEPRLPSGRSYPTGLYSFLAKYAVKGRSYSVAQIARVAEEAFVNPGWLAWARSTTRDPVLLHGITELVDVVAEARRIYASGGELRSEYRYSDPLDYLFNNEAGQVILHDLSESALGRGWRLKEVQTLHALGNSHALVIGPEGKHVFTAAETIQQLYTGKFWGLSASPDGTTLYAAGAAGSDAGGADTVFRLGDTVAALASLPQLHRTDTYNDYRQDLESYIDHYDHDCLTVTIHAPLWDGSLSITLCNDTPVYYTRWGQSTQVGAPRTSTSVRVEPRIAGMAVAADGTIFVSDSATHRIFRIDPGGALTVVAGRTRTDSHTSSETTLSDGWHNAWTVDNWTEEVGDAGFTPDGSPFAGAQIDTPGGLLLDDDGNLLFAETGSHRIRRLNFSAGQFETFAGTGGAELTTATARALAASLPSPSALARSSSGDVYALLNLPGDRQIVAHVDSTGWYHHLAGAPGGGLIDTGVDGRLYALIGARHLAAGNNGRLFVSVEAQHKVLVMSADGFVDVLAGTGEQGAAGDGGSALAASIIEPRGIVATPEGNAIVVDGGHESVRLVSSAIGSLGYTRFHNPLGYRDSTLRREADGTWMRSYKSGHRVEFDAGGRHVATVDRNGNRATYDYDGDRLAAITYPGGGRIDLRYDLSTGLLQEIADHAGRVTRFDTSGRDLVGATLPDGARREFRYDGAGRLLAQVSPTLATIDYSYNEYGRLVGQSQASQTFSIERPDDAAAGNRAAQGTPITAGSAQTTIKSAGEVASQVSLVNGRPVLLENASGETLRIDYSPQALPVKITRPNGQALSVAYNGRGDVTEVHDEAISLTESFEYDQQGRRIRHTDAVGLVTRWTYDGAGNVLSERTGAHAVGIACAYDGVGQLVQRVEGGVTTTFEYGAHGNVRRETRGGEVTDYEHDEAGNVTARALGNRRTSYRYDACNRLVAAIEARGQTTCEYDAEGHLTRLTDPLGGIHRSGYDTRGNTVERVDPAGATWRYAYDEANRVVSEAAPDGALILLEYADDGRKVRKTAGGRVVELEYLQDRSFLRGKNEVAEVVDHFDPAGRHVGQEVRLPGHQPILIYFELDASGRRTAIKSPGETVYCQYDDDGHLAKLTCGALQVDLAQDSSGRLVKTSRGGVETTIDYDAAGRIALLAEDRAGERLVERSIAYGPTGDCIAIARSDAGWTYEYDADGQLTKATRGGADPLVLEYAYDANGNRVSGPAGPLRYDAHGLLLLEDGGFAYRYDARGNVVEKASKTDPAERHLFEYSAFGQLSGYRREDGGAKPAVAARYFHDPLGRRIGMRVQYRDTPERDQSTWWIYDGDNIFLELDGDLRVTRQYVGTGEVDNMVGFVSGGQPYYYVKGHLGSIEQVLDQVGAVRARYDYDPFGNLLLAEETLPNAFRFTGRDWDAESSTYHFRNRHYDPSTGRFLQRDPHPGDPEAPISAINRYTYVRNSPLNLVDPYGLSIWDVVRKIGTAIAAAAIALLAIAFMPAIIAAATIGFTVLVHAVALAVIGGVIGGLIGGAVGLFNGDGWDKGFKKGVKIGVFPGVAIAAGVVGVAVGLVGGVYGMLSAMWEGESIFKGLGRGFLAGFALGARAVFKLANLLLDWLLSHKCKMEYRPSMTGPNFLRVAHHGSPLRLPENTLPSLELALSEGANALEIDLCMTSDRRIVLWHDWEPNGPVALVRQDGLEPHNAFQPVVPSGDYRRNVSNLSLAELREHYGYARQSVDLYPDRIEAHIPTLEEFVSWAAAREASIACVLLDIKMPCDESSLAGEMVTAIRNAMSGTNVPYVLLVPRENVLMAMAAKEPSLEFAFDVEVPAGLVLNTDAYSGVQHALNCNERFAREGNAASIHTSSVGRPTTMTLAPWSTYQDIVEHDVDLRSNHKEITRMIAWTIDDEHEMECLIAMGVDAILTNYLSLLKSKI